jgi:MYND finger
MFHNIFFLEAIHTPAPKFSVKKLEVHDCQSKCLSPTMSSRPSNLIPLLALTAATATTFVAYLYLRTEDKKSATDDEVSQKKLTSGMTENEGTTSGHSDLTLKTHEDIAAELLQHKETTTPCLAEVSFEEETSSGGSTPERIRSPPTVSDHAPNDETPKGTELLPVKITIDASVDDAAVTTTESSSKGNNGSNDETAAECVTENNQVAAEPVTMDVYKIANSPTGGAKASSQGIPVEIAGSPTTPVASGNNPLDPTNNVSEVEGVTAKQEDGTENVVPPGKSKEAIMPELAQEVPNASAVVGGDNHSTIKVTTPPSVKDNEDGNITTTPALESTAASEEENGNIIATPVPVVPAVTSEGEVEINELDLWQFLQKEMAQIRRCAGCNADEGNKKFKPCAKCRLAFYCDRACQKKDWKHHKKVCCK